MMWPMNLYLVLGMRLQMRLSVEKKLNSNFEIATAIEYLLISWEGRSAQVPSGLYVSMQKELRCLRTFSFEI